MQFMKTEIMVSDIDSFQFFSDVKGVDIVTVGKGKGGDPCTAAAFFKVRKITYSKLIQN